MLTGPLNSQPSKTVPLYSVQSSSPLNLVSRGKLVMIDLQVVLCLKLLRIAVFRLIIQEEEGTSAKAGIANSASVGKIH